MAVAVAVTAVVAETVAVAAVAVVVVAAVVAAVAVAAAAVVVAFPPADPSHGAGVRGYGSADSRCSPRP